MTVINAEKEQKKTDRTPNKEQRECIENNLSKYLVIAGPGTGKTYTISEKIKYIVEEEKIAPEKILCLTFSETAAKEMKERAGSKYPVNVYTFHGFCLEIIKNFDEEFDFESLEIISDSNKRAIINECIQELHSKSNFVGYNNNQNNPYKYSKDILDGIEEIKKNRVNNERFFYNLNNNPLWVPRLAEFPKIIEQKQKQIAEKEQELAKNIAEHDNLTKGKREYQKNFITPLKNEIKSLQREVDEEIPKKIKNTEKSIAQMKELWSLYKLYEQKKKQSGLIDFNDMINSVLEKFDDPKSNVLQVVSDMYEYVLVDEYQDTNSAQNEIVFKLGEYCPHLFVVGDDDQIIYSFQGAHLDTIENLIKKFDMKKENINCLKDNHRSTEAILKAADSIAKLQDDFAFFQFDKRKDENYDGKNIPLRLCSNPDFKELGIDKKLNPANKDLTNLNKSVEYLSFNTRKNEMNTIINRIADIINPENTEYKTPEKLSEIAILTKTNEELYEYETYLKAKGISVELTKGKNIFQINSVLAMITYMQFLISPAEYSDKMFAYLLMMPFHINPNDYIILKRYCKNNKDSLIYNMNKLLGKPVNNDLFKSQIYAILKKDSNTMVEEVQNVLKMHSSNVDDSNEILTEPDKIENFVKIYNYLKNYVISENYKNAILEIGTKTGIFNYYFSQEINRAENIKGINQLINEADSFFAVNTEKEKSFVHFVQYLTNMMNTGAEILTEKDDKPANAVQLSTYHSSKGREFEYVFMPNLHRQKWEDNDSSKSHLVPEIIPSDFKDKDTFESLAEKIKEAKFLDSIKLLYVGMTRAKHSLTLSFANDKIQPCWFITQFKNKAENLKLNDGRDVLNFFEIAEDAEYIEPIQNYNYKDFDKSTLPTKHSPTSLNTYLECPMRYFYSYVLKISNDNSEDENMDNMNFGTAVHATFEKIIEFAQIEKKYPETIEQVLAIFDEEIQKLNFSHFEDMKKRGYDLFEYYYPKFITLANPETTTFETEKSKTFKIKDEKIGEIEFYGKVDRIDTDENGICTIYDYKTGENTNITKKGAHKDYYYQLGFYKYLMKKEGKKVDKVCFIYPALKDENQENEIYIDELTDEECECIANEYIDAVRKIYNFEFDKPEKPACTYCNYKQWCLKQKLF